MKSFHAAFCAVLFGVTGAANANALKLKAYTLDSLSWEMAVNLDGCSLQMTRGFKSSKKALLTGTCQKLSELLQQVKVDEGPTKLSAGEVVGDYRYEFEIKNKIRPVKFNAPELCEIQADGELDCERQKLSPLEEMLLILRPYK